MSGDPLVCDRSNRNKYEYSGNGPAMILDSNMMGLTSPPLLPFPPPFKIPLLPPTPIPNPIPRIRCSWDRLKKECMSCGPDITWTLSDTLDKIKRKYNSQTQPCKQAMCDSLTTLYGLKFAYAWDIVDLSNKSGPSTMFMDTEVYHQHGCTLSACCQSSVQVGSECFKAYTVNYVMFGLIWKLCGNRYGYMRDIVALWKIRYADLEVYEALSWAEAGYHGWPMTSTPTTWLTDYCPLKCRYPVDIHRIREPGFEVHWLPLDNF